MSVAAIPKVRKPLPLIGHAIAFQRGPLEFLQAAQAEHGDVFRFRLGTEPIVYLAHPDLIRDVFIGSARSFTKGKQFEKLRSLVGNGVATSEEPFHMRQRRLVQPAFQQARITRYADTMVDLAAEFNTGWTPGEVVQIDAELRRVTLRTAARTLFSSGLPEATLTEITDCLLVVLKTMMVRVMGPDAIDRVPVPANKRYFATIARLRSLIDGVVSDYRAAGVDHGDLLSMLLLATDEDTNERMDDEQLRDEALTMLLAGYETTASALAWAMYEIATHPEVEERLRAELHEVLGGAPVGPDVMQRLPYARSVMHEVLRLHPSVWMLLRRVASPWATRGHEVPVGTSVMVCAYALHRDERFWPDANRFDPDRWSGERAGSIQRNAYLPFGAGSRRCVGDQFALTEAVIILATMLSRWRFQLVPGADTRAVMNIVMYPRSLPMRVEPVTPAAAAG